MNNRNDVSQITALAGYPQQPEQMLCLCKKNIIIRYLLICGGTELNKSKSHIIFWKYNELLYLLISYLISYLWLIQLENQRISLKTTFLTWNLFSFLNRIFTQLPFPTLEIATYNWPWLKNSLAIYRVSQKKRPTFVLLKFSTYKQCRKLGHISNERWHPYIHFECKLFSVIYRGAEV